MRSFLNTLTVFLIPVAGYCLITLFLLPALISISKGPSTREQIEQSFKGATEQNYEVLILGNSRTYRGIDPDAFSVSTYNFSHDNDAYNQVYYKLRYLEANNKTFSRLILGIDYFQFSFKSDSRNYVYNKYFEPAYMADFDKGPLACWLDHQVSNLDPKKFFALRPGPYRPYLKNNGQYIMHGVATAQDSIRRDITRLAMQERYFERVLDWCRERNIQVFIVMPPLRPVEFLSYTEDELEEFAHYIARFVDNRNVLYLDYSRSTEFGLTDFTDVTHLNEDAAKKFSKMLSDVLELSMNN